MLPADTIAEITTAIAALHLTPDTTAQILAAVFAPLLRTGPDLAPPDLPPARIYKRRAVGRLRARPLDRDQFLRRTLALELIELDALQQAFRAKALEDGDVGSG